MPNDVVPHGIKIEWNMSQNGIPVVNRVYVTKTGAIGSADLDDAAVAALAFYNQFKALQHATCVLQNITVTDVSVANSIQLVLPVSTGNTGTGGGAAAGANVAMCASLRTANIGRSFRGRFYLGGLDAGTMTSAQSFSATYANNFAGFLADFIDALNAINMTLVVVSRFAAGVARITAVATEIISIIVDGKVDSQRRRTAN